jgi:hypothetical protein
MARAGETFLAYTARVYVAHLAALGVRVTVDQLREAMSRAKGDDAGMLRQLAATTTTT